MVVAPRLARTTQFDKDTLMDATSPLPSSPATPCGLPTARRPRTRCSVQATWSQATTEQDLQQVGSLRARCYRAMGKVRTEAGGAQLSGDLDREACVLMAEIEGRLVGSARILMPNRDDDRIELGTQVGDLVRHGEWQEIVEVSRLCVAPRLWGSDLFRQLVSRSLQVAMAHGRRRILACAAGSMVSTYLEMGARLTGQSLSLFDEVRHEVIEWDMAKLARGEGISQQTFEELVLPAMQRLEAA